MSGPSNFNTPERVIRFAMKDAGLLQEGEEPNSDEYAQYMSRLNDLINTFQTRGLKLWVNSIQQVNLVAGTAAYALGPGGSIISVKPVRVLEGYYVASGGESRPLDPLAWNDYNNLSTLTQQGAVTGYFVDKQQTNLSVKFWLVPDASAATGHVDLLIQRQITNVVSLNDTIAFPLEWYMALRWGLADDICGGQSEAIMARCEKRAGRFLEALEDWDVEDAGTQFQPEARAQGGSMFR